MAAKKTAQKSSSGLPVFERLPMGLIREPKLAARATMSDARMQELIASFKEIGQIEPITVERSGKEYEIVTGHRRYLAARQCGWTEISAMVYEPGAAHSMAMMLHENIVREQLNPAEEALFMAQAREQYDLDEQGLCELFKRPATYIGNRFALLRGDPKVFSALQRGEIRVGVAHELNRIAEDDMRFYYLDIARRSDPTRNTVHQWVNEWELQKTYVRGPGVEGTGAASGAEGAPGAAGNGNGAGAVGVPDPPPVSQPFFGCDLCGGARDPYNLVTVRMHKWEWDQILKQVAAAARGE